MRWLPGLDLLLHYERGWLPRDLGAGLVLVAMLVPQGMAYAELAGLPAVTGLYTTVLSLLAYAAFGPSRRLVLGPDSSLAPLIAAAIVPLAAGDDAQAIALGAMLGLLTGVVCVATGLARLGAITELLSMPVRIGYINGIALVVLVSQLPKLFGFSTDSDGFLDGIGEFVSAVLDGATDVTALAIGAVSLALIVGMRRMNLTVVGMLAAVVGSMLVVGLLDLDVAVVGSLPGGFPALAFPDVGWSETATLSLAALGIALVAFADTAALSNAFAAKTGDDVDTNQEVIALGTANLAAGLFSGFPTSASSSRTAVADAIGSKSQLTGIVGAGGILLLLAFATDLLADLPSTTLAAVVIAASFTLFDAAAMRTLLRIRRSEFLLSMGALLGVTIVGVLEGIVIAVVLSLGNFVRKAWRPYDAELARVDGLRGYHDISRHPGARRIPGLVIIRFDAPLFFANAEHFRRRLLAAVHADPDIRRVVVAAEPITDVDMTAAETLERLIDELGERGVQLAFAEMKGPVKDRLHAYGLYERIGDAHFHPTLGKAVSRYVKTTGTDWVDWTDR